MNNTVKADIKVEGKINRILYYLNRGSGGVSGYADNITDAINHCKEVIFDDHAYSAYFYAHYEGSGNHYFPLAIMLNNNGELKINLGKFLDTKFGDFYK